MDFDSTRLYYSHQQLQRNSNNDNNVLDVDEYGNPIATSVNGNNAAANNGGEDQVHLPAVRRHFREFLRTSLFLMIVLFVAVAVVLFLDRPP